MLMELENEVLLVVKMYLGRFAFTSYVCVTMSSGSHLLCIASKSSHNYYLLFA